MKSFNVQYVYKAYFKRANKSPMLNLIAIQLKKSILLS